MKKYDRIVVAYSGGLDTSVIVSWLLENRANEVICFTGDVGQGEDLDAVLKKARKSGAADAVVADLREEFVRDYVYPSIMAHAIYQGTYLMGTAIARPIVGKALVECAREFKADAICHGATGKGNDQLRFENAVYSLDPDLDIVSPWREWEFEGRGDLLDYCHANNIDLGHVSREKPYSMDANLMHISYEGGVLEDPWHLPDEDMFIMTTDPTKAPDTPETVEIDFERGRPVAVNGEALGPIELLTKLNELAGKHGIGRVDIVEDRVIGLKSRGVYETPGGTLLHLALRGVESLTLDRQQVRLLDDLAPTFAQLVYDGLWFASERRALSAMVEEIQKNTTGTARLMLYKGSARVTGRKAPKSLYDERLASFDEAGGFVPEEAGGFIRLQSLRLRLAARRDAL